MELDQMAGIVAEAEGVGKDTIEYNITRFVQILRHLGVRVSLAETMDAMSALTRVDLLSRNQVRGVLRACLAKSRREAEIFEKAFNIFFTSAEEKLKRQKMRREMQIERERLISEAQQDLPEKAELTDMQLETFSLLPEDEKGRLKDILERMKGNQVNNPGELINRVLQSSLNYWRYYMMKNKMESRSHSGLEAELTGDDELDEVIQSVAAQFYHNPGDRMLYEDMESLNDCDLPRVTSLINHISSRMAIGMSRRYKKSARAVSVDIRRTVRRNIRFGGIPLELRYRSRRRRRPKFVLICDVSASMARYARFVLQFIYGLSSAVRDIESFIFSEDLERITPFFRQKRNFAQNMTDTINASRQWGKSTNLYEALKTFDKSCRNILSPETIVFVVSDTRTVSPENSARLLGNLRLKCGDIIWLNTLPAREWAGQAQVALFKSVVDMYECNTLAQMERAMRRHVLDRI